MSLTYINAGLLSAPIFALMSTQAAAAGDVAYGAYLSGECLACHRPDADAAIPPIDTLPIPYFKEALNEYRTGQRDHELMGTIARSLGDAEIEALAVYFAQINE